MNTAETNNFFDDVNYSFREFCIVNGYETQEIGEFELDCINSYLDELKENTRDTDANIYIKNLFIDKSNEFTDGLVNICKEYLSKNVDVLNLAWKTLKSQLDEVMIDILNEPYDKLCLFKTKCIDTWKSHYNLNGYQEQLLYTYVDEHLRQCNAKEFRRDRMYELLEQCFEDWSEQNTASVLVEWNNISGEIKIVDDSFKKCYIWNDSSSLWKETNIQELKLYVSKFLIGITDTTIKRYESELIECNTESVRKNTQSLINLAKSYRRKVGKSNYISGVITFLAPQLYDSKFKQKISKPHSHFIPVMDNKVVNLKTLKLEDRIKEHYFTYEISIRWNPNANLDVCDKYLKMLFCDNIDLVKCFKTIMGSCLTGEVVKHLFFFFGPPNSGKTTIMDGLMSILSPSLCDALDQSVLACIRPSGSSHTSNIMPLKYLRFATIAEPGTHFQIDGPLLKRLSGGDTISVREIHSKQETFRVFSKIILYFNQLGQLNIDKALESRIVALNFKAEFVDNPDIHKHQYKAASRSEMFQFFEDNKESWLLFLAQGAQLFYKEGIYIPQEVRDTNKTLYGEIDIVQDFIDTYCDIGNDAKGHTINASELYNHFMNTMDISTGFSQTKFGRSLTSKGFKKGKDKTKSNLICYFDIKLKDTDISSI